MAVVSIFREFGFPVALVIVFVTWTYRREQHLTSRLDKVQDDYVKALATVVADNTNAVNALKDALCDRPCMVEKRTR